MPEPVQRLEQRGRALGGRDGFAPRRVLQAACAGVGQQLASRVFEGDGTADQVAEPLRQIVEGRSLDGGPRERAVDALRPLDRPSLRGQERAVQLLGDARERHVPGYFEQRQAEQRGGLARAIREARDEARNREADRSDPTHRQRPELVALGPGVDRPGVAGREEQLVPLEPRSRVRHVDHVRPAHGVVEPGAPGDDCRARQGRQAKRLSNGHRLWELESSDGKPAENCTTGT